MIADYTAQSLNTTEDADKFVDLIATLEEMRDEYALYIAGISTYKFHAVYSPAVAAVVAFFNMKGYKLSAELLTHAKNNTKINSTIILQMGKELNRLLLSPILPKAIKSLAVRILKIREIRHRKICTMQYIHLVGLSQVQVAEL